MLTPPLKSKINEKQTKMTSDERHCVKQKIYVTTLTNANNFVRIATKTFHCKQTK